MQTKGQSRQQVEVQILHFVSKEEIAPPDYLLPEFHLGQVYRYGVQEYYGLEAKSLDIVFAEEVLEIQEVLDESRHQRGVQSNQSHELSQ